MSYFDKKQSTESVELQLCDGKGGGNDVCAPDGAQSSDGAYCPP